MDVLIISVLRFQKLRAKKGEWLTLGYDAEGSKTFMVSMEKEIINTQTTIKTNKQKKPNNNKKTTFFFHLKKF